MTLAIPFEKQYWRCSALAYAGTMGGTSGEGETYLLIGDNSAIDTALLTVLLEGATTAVETARSHATAAKKLATNSYSGIILTDPDSCPYNIENPIIALYDSINGTQPDWVARNTDVHVLHYDSENLHELVSQIQGIVTDASVAAQQERHQHIQNVLWDVMVSVSTIQSRDEFEELICRRLTTSGLYQTAWFSRHEQGELVPYTAAGIDTACLSSVPVDDRHLDALDVRDDGHCVLIPIQQDEVVGSLTLTATPEIDTVEQDLLQDFGATLSAVIQRIDGQLPSASDAYIRSFSHELGNHLQNARAALESSEDSNRVREELDQIEQLDREAMLLTQESLDANELGVYPLAELVDSVQERLPDIADRVSVQESHPIRTSRPLAELLLENLFRNTRDHAESSAEIRVGTVEDGFYVEDTGEGLPDASTNSLFQWGYAVNSSSGDGLAIVKRIVDLHGWEINTTESDEGGARFEITDVR